MFDKECGKDTNALHHHILQNNIFCVKYYSSSFIHFLNIHFLFPTTNYVLHNADVWMNGYLRRSKDQPWERKRGNKSCKKDCNKVNKGNLKRDNIWIEPDVVELAERCDFSNHFILNVIIYFISFVSYIFDYPPYYYSKMFHVISWGIKL